jgi:type II secretion system protein N
MNLLKQQISRLLPDNLSGAGLITAYIFTGLLLFLIGLLVFFPEDTLRQKLQYELARNIPGKVVIGNASLRLPYSIHVDNLLLRLDDRTIPELKLDSLTLTPHLSSLIGRPGLCFKATDGNGHISGSVSKAGAVSLDIENYPIDQPVQGFSDLRLAGKITSGQIEADLQSDLDNKSIINLQAVGLSLKGTSSLGLTTDQINLGQLELEIVGKGRSLSMSKAVLRGGDVLAEAGGTFLVGRTIPSTRLNLNITVKAAASLDPSVTSLFELIGAPGREGARKVTVRGTLAAPKVQ